MNTPTKRCTKCRREFPATPEFFYTDRHKKNGISQYCKSCTRNNDRNYREANPEKIRERKRGWYKANREKVLEYVPKWREANPEKLRAQQRARHTRKRNAEGIYTIADICAQYERQKGHCYYCGCDLHKDFHVDHIIPLSRGGTNWPSNLVCACAHCNTSKQNKLPHEWPEGGRLL